MTTPLLDEFREYLTGSDGKFDPIRGRRIREKEEIRLMSNVARL